MPAATIMLVMMGLFGLIVWPWCLLVIPLSIIGGLLFSALGLITTALCPKIDMFNLPIFVLVFPMFLFSGTFFPVDILPIWAFWVALALPLTHVSFLVRGACLGVAPPLWYAIYPGHWAKSCVMNCSGRGWRYPWSD